MDPYKVLGINKEDSDSEIKKAYRKLAVKHHPDKGGDEDKFKEICNAYETLSNKEKRQQYDNFGSFDLTTDPTEIFNQFFGNSYNHFMDPTNLVSHPFSGFNQGDPIHGMMNLNTFLGSFSPGSISPGSISPGNISSFSQTTYIQNGKKITKTTRNGQTTITEQLI